MNLEDLPELKYGDIIEVSGGFDKSVGYFLRADDSSIYLSREIPVLERPPGYGSHIKEFTLPLREADVKLIKQCNQPTPSLSRPISTWD